MTIRLLNTAFGHVALAAALFAAFPAYPLAAQRLPENAPVPAARPVPADPPKADETLPTAVPVPSKRPEAARQAPVVEGLRLENDTLANPPPELLKPSKEELACREELRKLGAVFQETTIPAPKNGCSVPFPIEVSTLATGANIKAAVTLNCATALASAKFVRDVIQPAAQKTFSSPVKSIAQASGYVCRPRNGTTKLSEHAFGNALDIASFTLANGHVVEVKPAPPEKDQEFMKSVRDAACGPFKTVLGPGSNADHAYHFHFDLAQRRNGSTYCK